MTVVLEAEAALAAPAIPQSAPHDATEALEEIIAAHRQVLLELAPHQAWRSVREETAWHMEHLGVLLCHRDAQTQNAAPGGVPDRKRREESTSPARQTR